MANKPNKNIEQNRKGALFFLVGFLLIAGFLLWQGEGESRHEEISQQKLIELVKSNKILGGESTPLELIIRGGASTQELRGFYKKEVNIEATPPAFPSTKASPEVKPVSETKSPATLPETSDNTGVSKKQEELGPQKQEQKKEQEQEQGHTTPKPHTITTPFKTQIYVQFNGEEIQNLLKNANLTPSIKTQSDFASALILNLLPMVLFIAILLWIFSSQMKGAGKGPFGFGKSKAKRLEKDTNKVTFKDVAGVEEAKEEVSELVEFLKDPKKFQKIGGRIPKGVLMCGPPGTGKTLLAKAIANEADVPFFSISGSDFVEMFVGVGASRVRDMFEEGKKNAPCLIFIDEIDAVGRHRGAGLGGGHDEREQTLNALLVEMDGFDSQSGIIIIAATNRPDVLDPALLRPGRFDRQVTVDLPDVKGREEILKVHCRKAKVSENVNLEVIAKGTPGYSGAELENVVNEAALLAARKNLSSIGMQELEEARDKVRWGKERRSLSISDKEKENTAYHEAGHAILLVLLEHTEPLHKVTIIPRGPSLGSTMWLPQSDKYNTRKKELLDHLVVIMGGRVAEDIIFGDVTSGAYGDIKQASQIARNMVCKWGMSEKIGMIIYGGDEEQVFLGKDLHKSRGFSEKTAQDIDLEVKRIIDEAYKRAKTLLLENKSKLDIIAKALLEFETLEGKEIEEIMESNRLDNIRANRNRKIENNGH